MAIDNAAVIDGFNGILELLGVADRYLLSWNDELCNEGICAGTVTDLDSSDEFVLGVQLCKNGAYFTVCAEGAARFRLKHDVRIGDYLKVRVYLKPAMFKGEHCYLHIDDEKHILQLIREGNQDAG